jgi:hypothetical protein
MIRLLIVAVASFTLAAAELPTKAPCAAVRIDAPLAVTPAQVGIGGLPLAFLQLGPGQVPCDGHPEKYVCTWVCIQVPVGMFINGWYQVWSQTVCFPRCECTP